MVTVRVGTEERDVKDVDQQWLCKQINGRRHEHQSDCVIVRIKADNIDMVLSTPGCAAGGGGGRAPNHREAEIFDLWAKAHLNDAWFSCGNVHEFLVHLRRLA